MTKWHMLYIFNTVLYSRNFIYFVFFFCFRSILLYIYTLLEIPRFLRNSLNMLASFLDSIRDLTFNYLYLGWPKAGPVYKIP